MSRLQYLMVGCLLAVSSIQAGSQPRTMEDNAKGLNIIANFADGMCKQFALEGSSKSRINSISAEVEVSKLLKVLVGAKLLAGSQAENTAYQGLLQKDLLGAMSESNGCKERYFNQLIERILPTKPIVLRHEQTSRMVHIETLTPDGQRCVEIQDVRGISKNCARE